MESRQCANEAEAARTNRREVAERRSECSREKEGDADPLREAQDGEFEEVERDVATEDGINDWRAARVEGDRVLPEADRLPVRSDLRANKERHEECADAQDTTPNRGNRAATTAGVEEVAERLANAIHTNLSALIHQRLALWSRRPLTRLAWRCATTSCNHGRDPNHQEEEDQRRKGAPRKEGALNL